MESFKELENKLYEAIYIKENGSDAKLIWNQIKSNIEILKEAIKPTKDKFGERDKVKGLTICNSILVDYKNVDSKIYEQLVNLIYSNEQIARIVLNYYSNDGYYSLLLMTLWNFDLKLTDEQKNFAVNEALTQEHGRRTLFDIRYWILRNPNWTLEEKMRLVYEFYTDDEDYDEHLEQWEWSVVNDNENYKGEPFPPFDKYDLFHEWSYEMLLEYHGNKETTDRIWEEMEFCKQMHQLRPQQWEMKYKEPKKTDNNKVLANIFY